MKQQWLLAMLLLVVVAMLAPSIDYATPNQTASENFTNTTNVFEIAENNTNSTIIQNTTTAVVNDTTTNHQLNQTSESSNGTQNSSLDDSNQTDTIQNDNAAASDGIYNNVHGLWLNVDDVNNVDVDELIKSGITDVFVKANRISTPTYQTVLTTIINKLKGTDIRIHAWITCFVDTQGNWVDPKDSNYTDALVKSIANITTNYDIAGIHLDYVRYPGTAYKYTGGTTAITSFVKQVYETVKSIKAKVAVSAALMPECAANAYYYGQDYAVLSNYLDFLVPMIYKGNYNEDTDWITTTTAYIVNHSTKPVIAGLQTYKSDNNLVAISADEINQDIESAISGGSSGFVLFRYGWVDKDFFESQYSNTSNTFTVGQILDAASSVKAYIESNKALPSTVTIGAKSVNMAQFLYLAAFATSELNSGKSTSSTVAVGSYSLPGSSSESLSAGSLTVAGYVNFADRIVQYIADNNQAPPFGVVGLGNMGYQSQIYLYSRVLAFYKDQSSLPAYAVVKSWSASNIPINGLSASTTTFTVGQILDAASSVKAYIESNKALPSTVTIGAKSVNMAQFLYLAAFATSELNSGKSTSSTVAVGSYSLPGSSSESLSAGSLTVAGYVNFADRIVQYIADNNQAPPFGVVGLGNMGYQSQIYLYSRVLAFYKDQSSLPAYAVVKSWSASNIPINGLSASTTTFTVGQILDAASSVKAYIESNKALPSTVTIGAKSVNMAQFLYLAAFATSELNSGKSTSSTVAVGSYSLPGSSSESLSAGSLTVAGYVNFADRIVQYIADNNQAPPFGVVGLGNMGYQSQIYLYSRVLAFYKDQSSLPAYAVVKSWSASNIPINGLSASTTTFTVGQILDAASSVKAYIESNKALPSTVTIGAKSVNMAQFLYLAAFATSELNSGKSTSSTVAVGSYSLPGSSSESLSAGSLTVAGYVNFADRIVQYIADNNQAPPFGVIDLGQISYESQIYLYARIMAFYDTNGVLPNYATIKTWKTVTGSTDSIVPAGMEQYLQPTANCQSGDSRIIAMAQSITSGATSSYDKAQRIFNWVRDNLEYSMYYDTKYGAVNTLLNREGNCVDHSHLIVALSRAAGLPARYVHGVCTFTSGNTYGHVFAQIYANGQWYNADATSYRNELGVIRNWNTNSWTYKGTYTSLPF